MFFRGSCGPIPGRAEAAKFIIDHFGLDVNVKIPEEPRFRVQGLGFRV